VKACILAQVWSVSGDASTDGPVAFVKVSDGVGVGIAADGKLLRGAHNIAGEYGHVPLHMFGPVCSCGQRGCWEAYVSNRAIVARYLGADRRHGCTGNRTKPNADAYVVSPDRQNSRHLATSFTASDPSGTGYSISIDAGNVYFSFLIN